MHSPATNPLELSRATIVGHAEQLRQLHSSLAVLLAATGRLLDEMEADQNRLRLYEMLQAAKIPAIVASTGLVSPVETLPGKATTSAIG